jgi:hypothetical protein
MPYRVRAARNRKKTTYKTFLSVSSSVLTGGLRFKIKRCKGTLQKLFKNTGARTRSQLVRAVLEQYRDLL